jgi:hypothetical protein
LMQQSANSLGLGPLRYDPFSELCSNLTFTWANQAIAGWLAEPGNQDQVVGGFLDNRVSVLSIDLVTAALKSVWGASLMTPGDVQTLFGGVFPSRAQMLAAGKRFYCESNSYWLNDYANTSLASVCFYPTTWSALQLDDDAVAPFPNCTASGDASWYGRNWTRVLDSGDLSWSPAEDSESSVIYKPNGIADLAACGFNNIGAGEVSLAVAQGFLWSWAPGHPAAAALNGSLGCTAAAMTLVRGQWTAQPCAAAFPAVCRFGDARVPSGAAPQWWNVTAAAVPFAGAAAECAKLGAGWAFDTPRDGRENALVAAKAAFGGLWEAAVAAGRAPGLWLNVPVSA